MESQSPQNSGQRFAPPTLPPPPPSARSTLTVGDGPNDVIPFDIGQAILRQLRADKPNQYKRYLAEAYVPSNGSRK